MQRVSPAPSQRWKLACAAIGLVTLSRPALCFPRSQLLLWLQDLQACSRAPTALAPKSLKSRSWCQPESWLRTGGE